MSKRKFFWIVLLTLLLFLVVVGGYVVYVFLAYDRLPKRMELKIFPPKEESEGVTALQVGVEYTAVTYNIGFGAYTPDFSFFMDGGTESVAASAESVTAAVDGAARCVHRLEPDFALFQEVDLKATRSHYVNEFALINRLFPEYWHIFAVNYDSPFLFYPILEPHGRTKAGMATYSRFPIETAVRRALPISENFDKFFDLDRCFSVVTVPVENGKKLVVFHVHLSAYSEDARIREGQTNLLMHSLDAAYRSGNYVLCAGDFNHDMKNLTQAADEVFSWAHVFPRESLPKHFFIVQDLFSEKEKAAMPDSSRNADIPYIPGETMTITLDAFIVSDNIEPINYRIINHGFLYSDHQPVEFSFRLKN